MPDGLMLDLQGGPQQADAFVPGPYDEGDLGQMVMRRKQDATSIVKAWQALAKQDFAFYHSHQWDDVDRLRMEQQKRPALVFNRLKATVDAISGLERLNRMSVRF